MAIGDIIEMTDAWSRDRIAAVDEQLTCEGLPTLSSMRVQFSKLINRVVTRGRIENDVEFHAIRNAAELSQDEQEALWKLISAYEERLTD